MGGRKFIAERDETAVLAALSHRPLRDECLVRLGLNSGFRISELLSIRVGQVAEGGKIRPAVTVARGRLKGGHGRHAKSVRSRTVPLNEAATAILQQYLFERFGSGPVDPEAPLFPSRRHGHTLQRWRANAIIVEVMQAAGLASHQSYGTHSLRKTFANRIYCATGHDINLTRAALGHANVSTTQRYLDVDEAQLSAAILGLGRPTPPVAMASPRTNVQSIA